MAMEKIMNNIINIVYSTDENYLPLMAVSIHSLIKNASKDYQYNIHVLYADGTIKNDSIERIKKLSNNNTTIIFKSVNSYIDNVKDKLRTRDYYSLTTYFRLFITNIYPELDKVLYIDCDTLVLGDISELYNFDLGDALVAGTSDDAVLAVKEFQDYVEQVVGVDNYQDYFNAGIILMNLKQFKEQKIFEKFLELNDKYYFVVAQDQDLLNVLCYNKVKYFDPGWNKTPTPALKEFKKLNLIHYNLSYKPWHYDNVMYSDEFWAYAKETDYYEDILDIKNSFSEEDKLIDQQAGVGLIQKALEEIKNENNYKKKFLL